MGKKTDQCLVLLLFLSGLVQCTTAMIFWTALVDISYFDNQINDTVNRYCECGVYGRNSPLEGASGIVTLPSHDPKGCGQDVVYGRNSSSPPWIALVKRGNCSFSEKIIAAERKGAAGVVIYNVDGTGNNTTHMTHSEVTDIVAIMIGNDHGMEIVKLVKTGLEVTMVIEVGSAHGLWMDAYWLYFLSIAFFIVTAASIAYFVFISAHRIHSMRMQRCAERKLKSEAKKAIGQLQVCTLKRGDAEVGSDSYMCAVCIDAYKAGEVVTVLTCGHIFHKACIEPWLLEKRTCPMCKCDILKALGVEEERKDERALTSSPAAETVITVSGGDPMYEVPLTDSPAPDPERHQHRYDNRAFEGDSHFATA
ncbi:E3 ubiquitin-protein ligase RNF128a [Lampris incognitus]|uniref:E3 ubiquitin-protein ligase RNF128a n=1 Tax=Lampris incognitus TaxID=2546036 RepID=UPI0024B48735|nr:E3 ubiquitin-protein ligase RNF128a [Lampris incognitus]